MKNLGSFLSILFAVVTFTSVGHAEVLEEGHLLYPADREFLMIMGLSSTMSPYGAGKALGRCDTGTARPKDLPMCDAGKMIRESSFTIKEFPWKSLTAQIVFFGERHYDQEIKVFLTEHMRDLRAQGFNALAMEMFEEFQQPILNRYLQGQVSDEELKKTIESVWFYESSGYLKVIAEARAQGMRIIALDDRANTPTQDFFENVHIRDRHMSQVLARQIQRDPSLKIVVLSGALHGFKNFSVEDRTLTMPSILRKQHSITTQSLTSYGDKDDNGFNSMQKAIYGPGISSVTAVPQYPYTDFLLFLR